MDDASQDEFLGDDLRVTTALMIGPSVRSATDPVLAQRLIESLDLFDDAHPRGAMPHEDESSPEVQRLEHKLDLLLHLVAESLHPERRIRWRRRSVATGLCCQRARCRRIVTAWRSISVACCPSPAFWVSRLRQPVEACR